MAFPNWSSHEIILDECNSKCNSSGIGWRISNYDVFTHDGQYVYYVDIGRWVSNTGIYSQDQVPTSNIVLSNCATGGGNVATSICNAVISNIAGIFITPALLFRFFGANIKLPFLAMVLKLCKKVLLPVGKYARCKIVWLVFSVRLNSITIRLKMVLMLTFFALLKLLDRLLEQQK